MYCYYCMRDVNGMENRCELCRKSFTSDENHSHLPAGTVLKGRYLVGNVLGQGGFGITYVGRDNTISLDVRIAIKEYYPRDYAYRDCFLSNDITLPSGNTEDSVLQYIVKGKEHFLSEAKTLVKFNRTGNIVHALDYFEENNTAYIIMDYVDGIDLNHYLRENGKVEPKRLVNWFMPILNVLSKVHDAGLIHRDINPSNLMVENGELVLIDFGTARDINIPKNLTSLVTKHYAPVEQYSSNSSDQGRWTDIYAVCATMYECITGITPPESTSRLFADELLPPSALGIQIPEYIEAALMHGMAVKHVDRPQNVEQLVAELTGTVVAAYSNKPTKTIPIDDPKTELIAQDNKDAIVEPSFEQKNNDASTSSQISSKSESHKPRLLLPIFVSISICILIFIIGSIISRTTSKTELNSKADSGSVNIKEIEPTDYNSDVYETSGSITTTENSTNIETTQSSNSQTNISLQTEQITYEEIYGSLVFDGVNNTKNLWGHVYYVSQPTGYRIQKYFLDDINNDNIKELILEVTLSGTDETFRECYTYEKGSAKWLGTYDDIYVAEECYVASDGNGLVVVSRADDEMEMFKGYAYRYWRPWDVVVEDNIIPYVLDFPKIGYYLTEYDNPKAIPDNIRNKLGKQLVAYSPTDRAPLKESFSSTSSSEQPVSNSSTPDKYTAIQGIVNTEKSDLMLRRLPDANDKTNVISKIPKGTKITLLLPFKSYFAQDDGDQTYWYYADYNGKTGFVSAKYIKETTDRVGMTDEQVTSVAKLLLLSAMNAESWSYSNCFDYNVDDRILYPNSNEYYFYHIKGLHTKEDWYAEVHKMFSAKYDSIRYFNEGLDSLLKNQGQVPPCYWNNNNEWYLSDVVFRKGDIPLDIAYSEPFRVVNLTKQRESENEVFFNGYLDYSKGQSSWLYTGDNDTITEFSICFEDGQWKIGYF